MRWDGIPLWLKWFAALLALGVFGVLTAPALGPDLWFAVVGWIVFLGCVLFPGPDTLYPRFFALISLLWLLAIPLFGLILVVELFEGGWAGLIAPSVVEGVPTLVLVVPMVLFAALLWTLRRRHRAFRPLVVLETVSAIAIQLVEQNHIHGSLGAMDLYAVLDVLLSTTAAAYLLLRFRPAPMA